MKLQSLLTVVASLLSMSLSANAQSVQQPPKDVAVQTLARITNDRDNRMSRMSLMVAKGEQVVGLFNELRDPNGKDESSTYTLAQLVSRKGVVLERQSGRDVIVLQATFDASGTRANMNVNYLTNGLLGRYKTCRLTMSRDSAGRWQLTNPVTGREVRDVRVVTHSLGVSRLEGACD